MNYIAKLLYGNDNNIGKKSILWNMAASMVYSFQSAILLLVVTRVAGLAVGGVFSIAYTVSQMFASIGSFSMRDYQVSDTNYKYSYSTYMTSRIITVTLMWFICLGYSIFCRYSGEKLMILMILSVYRGIDGFEDVIQGEIQRKGRLDISAKMLTLRIICATLVFIGAFIVTKNLLIAVIMFTSSAIFMSITINVAIFRVFDINLRLKLEGVARLLVECLPICVGAFLYNYLVNSPKYAIDKVLTSEMQTIFNIIFMPVFVTNMLGNFVFKPYVLRMGELWNSGDNKKLFKLLCKLFLIIVLIAIFVVLGGSIIGIPVLSLIYGVNLRSYRIVFIFLLIFGGISAVDTFFAMVLTVMRRQIFIIIGYITALVLDIIFMNMIVKRFELLGAGFVYGFAMLVILLVFCCGIVTGFIGKRGKCNGNKNV